MSLDITKINKMFDDLVLVFSQDGEAAVNKEYFVFFINKYKPFEEKDEYIKKYINAEVAAVRMVCKEFLDFVDGIEKALYIRQKTRFDFFVEDSVRKQGIAFALEQKKEHLQSLLDNIGGG